MDSKYKNIGNIEDRFVEEVGECLQALGKIKRFGLRNFHPDRPESNNAYELLAELRDLTVVLHDLENDIEHQLHITEGVSPCP